MDIIIPSQSSVGEHISLSWGFVELLDDVNDYMLLGLDLLRELGLVDDDGIHIKSRAALDTLDDGDDIPVQQEEHATVFANEPASNQIYMTEQLPGKRVQASVVTSSSVFTHEAQFRELLEHPDCTLSERSKVRMLSVLMKNSEVFDEKLPLEGSTLTPFKIEVTEDIVFHGRPRPLKPEVRAEAYRQGELLLSNGMARPAQGTYAHPAVMHKRKDKYRMCPDYSIGINKITKRHTYGPPLVKAVLQHGANRKYYGKFDLRSGYHQMMMEPNSIKYTGMVTPDHHIEFLRLPFGVTNGVDCFQEAMERLFKPMLYTQMMVFVDDLPHYADSEDEYINTVASLLSIALTARLRFSLEKTELARTQMEIVGYILSAEGRSMCPNRVTAISAMTAPKSVHDLKVLLGACNGFREFIPRYEELVRPFSPLLKKEVLFYWTDDMQTAFENLKAQLSCETILANGSEPGRLIVRADASDVAVGGSIIILDDSGQERVVAYFSKALNETQQRWTTYEKELYAILVILTSSSYSALLKLHEFTIETDHKNLVWLDNKSQDNAKLARWRRILMEFACTIKHIPGHTNCLADYLSRHHPDASGSADEILWLSTKPVEESEWIAKLRSEQDKVSESWKSKTYNSNARLYTTKSGMIMIPPSMMHDVISAAHSSADSGHLGINATVKAIRMAGYTWADLKKSVADFIKSCAVCQKYREEASAQPVIASGSTTCLEPWHTVHVDTLGPFPEDHGMSYLKVMTDAMTKTSKLLAVSSNDAIGTADALFKRVICGPGMPQKIVTDGGSEYCNSLVALIMEKLKVHHHTVVPHTPTANSPVERENKEIMRHLRCLLADFAFDKNWTELIPVVEYLLNHTYHSAIGTSPFILRHGSDPSLERNSLHALVSNTPLELQRLTKAEYQEYLLNLQHRLLRIHEGARQILKGNAQARLLSSNVDKPTEYADGDYVLLQPVEKANKLSPILLGPYKVIAKVNELTYRLQMITDPSKIIETTTRRMIPFKLREDYSAVELKELQAGDIREQLVDAVLEHQPTVLTTRESLQFLVKWVGHDDTHNSWVDYNDINGCAKLEEYLEKPASAPLKKLLRRLAHKQRPTDASND